MRYGHITMQIPNTEKQRKKRKKGWPSEREDARLMMLGGEFKCSSHVLLLCFRSHRRLRFSYSPCGFDSGVGIVCREARKINAP